MAKRQHLRRSKEPAPRPDLGPCEICLKNLGKTTPACQAIHCKLCDKRRLSCHEHHGEAKTMMNGHALRVHPEEFPKQIDEMPDWMIADFESKAKTEPDLWSKLVAVIHQRRGIHQGRAVAMSHLGPRNVSSVHEMSDVARANPGREPGGMDGMVRCIEKGWSFLLSYDSTANMWGFSAKLNPIRPATQDDWHFLGLACQAVGMPPKVHAAGPMGNTVATAPETVHKWVWFDGAAALGPWN